MQEAENIVRAFYDALAQGDLDRGLALLDPQVRWLEAERTPYYSGQIVGRDAVVETVLGPVSKAFENFSVTPLDFVTQDDRIAAFGEYTGRHQSGGMLRAPFVHLWAVHGGVITSFRQYTDSAVWAQAMAGTA